jgi:hypothetical protein
MRPPLLIHTPSTGRNQIGSSVRSLRRLILIHTPSMGRNFACRLISARTILIHAPHTGRNLPAMSVSWHICHFNPYALYGT